jgi:pyruvate/2-oxoglutarate/acetoin dehydrogenase E1 component
LHRGGSHGFDYLDVAPVNLAASDVPPLMSEPLEMASIPTVEKIVKPLRRLFN